MRFLQKLFHKPESGAPENAPATGDQLRANVRTNRAQWLARQKDHLTQLLQSRPPGHPGDLFHTIEKLAQYAFELAMLDWREGVDPRPRLADIENAFKLALASRPDLLQIGRNPGFMPIVSDLMGWNLPFDTAPPGEEERKFDMIWMERWLIAGLADPSCWPLNAKAPAGKNQFLARCLDDYWALLTGQADPDEGVQRRLRNYARRATHPTFKVLRPFDAGGDYNALFVDYTLAAIMKKRGIVSNSVHYWVWG